mgnify:CR=1 FL=1
MLINKYYAIYVEVPTGYPGVACFCATDMKSAWAFAKKSSKDGNRLAILDILEAR